MFDVRTNLSADVVREVRKFFPNLVYDTIIPRSVRLAEAPSYGLPISVYAPQSTSASAYAALITSVFTWLVMSWVVESSWPYTASLLVAAIAYFAVAEATPASLPTGPSTTHR